MRRLYFTIIVTVFGALFATGWGLDQLVDRNGTSAEDKVQSIETQLYRKIIDGISLQLNDVDTDKLPQNIARLSREFNVELQLESAINIALPDTLKQQLSQAGGLLLATEEQSYLLKSLTSNREYLVQLNLPPAENDNSLIDLFLTISLYLSVCLIVVLWSLPLTRRLYLLNSAAAKFGEGELSVRIPRGKFSYIHQLENSFNGMADQIEKLMADNKLLARSLSHDIRTPIACLRFGIEAALDTKDVAKKDQYIERMDNEISRMEQMTGAFLEYAGLERQVATLRRQPTELNEWLATVRHDFSMLAQQQGVIVVFKQNAMPVLIELDQQWFYRAIQNLVSNAIDYATSQVTIEVNVHGKDVEIMVRDDGPGISAQDCDSIFEPFVRLDAQRGRDTGHFGLGLAITAKVVAWHDGLVTASNNQAHCGACFCITIPRV